ncbi:hypothetical protein [Nannocystis pusilla]|uniref:hypothetical protein n=1 Tax=Nannocystis pusilla TaxID=889268 RepID=UPI003B7D51F6
MAVDWFAFAVLAERVVTAERLGIARRWWGAASASAVASATMPVVIAIMSLQTAQ